MLLGILTPADLLRILAFAVIGALLLWTGVRWEDRDTGRAATAVRSDGTTKSSVKSTVNSRYKTLPLILRVGGLTFLVVGIFYLFFVIKMSFH